eukprot:SM000049S16755  [mRNA]  locus=s49:525264:526325:- [translate_table: standard]
MAAAAAAAVAAAAVATTAPRALRKQVTVSAGLRLCPCLALRRPAGVITARRATTLRVSAAASPQTVDLVCKVIKSHLSLKEGEEITPDKKFTELGADSLDTVEIMMALEEQFDISLEEEEQNNDKIQTVQDAADLIQSRLDGGSA